MLRDVVRSLRITDGAGPASGTVRLERLVPFPPGAVWAACTEPDRLRRWLGELHGHAAPGSTVTLTMAPTDTVSCRVERCDAPRTLVAGWTWPGGPDSLVRLDLTAEGSGTRLVLEHRGLPSGSAAGYGAGWEDFLRALGEHLGDPMGTVTPVSWEQIEQDLLPRWEALAPRPAEQGGRVADG